jgi:hypothetical protein
MRTLNLRTENPPRKARKGRTDKADADAGLGDHSLQLGLISGISNDDINVLA